MKSGFGNNTSNLKTAIKPLTYGLVIGTVIIVLLFVLFALMMSFNILPIESANIISSISISTGTFFAGFFSAKKSAKNGLLIGVACGFLMFALTSIIGIAAFKTVPDTSFVIRLFIFVISGAIGGIIGVGNSDKRKIKY